MGTGGWGGKGQPPSWEWSGEHISEEAGAGLPLHKTTLSSLPHGYPEWDLTAVEEKKQQVPNGVTCAKPAQPKAEYLTFVPFSLSQESYL